MGNDQSAVSDIASAARMLEIRSRQLVWTHITGLYLSAFRGPGLDFSGFRPYTPGDEVRHIDWNVTARTGTPYVKRFQEEREKLVYVALDISTSMRFGSGWRSKLRLAGEVAAVLAIASLSAEDRAGLILFKPGSVYHIPPARGRSHGLKIIRCILQGASILSPALQPWHTTMARLPAHALIFLLSDFIPGPALHELAGISHKRDLVPIWIHDPVERNLPAAGIIPASDPESFLPAWLSLSSTERAESVNRALEQYVRTVRGLFRSLQLDHVELSTHRNFIDPLRKLMLRRLERQER